MFITFEGPEGAGKTTILEMVAKALENESFSYIQTREPGGIRISEAIRSVILNREHVEMDARTEALLYAASRRQHLVERVIPALENNEIVLCDRFIDSSLAYQGYARNIGIQEVWDLNQFAIQNCMPTLTLYFDIAPELGLERIAANKNREVNRLDEESILFHKRVYEGYKQVLQMFPNRIKRVDASQSMDAVFEECWKIITTHLKE
ncbi:dTMP kinase [Savagea faecisuis]|uniref:Thymidylate kinase n=1 Tax=Savagea faecisuis TaxID=1274803 RepID=A0ABW3GTL9_9BACL